MGSRLYTVAVTIATCLSGCAHGTQPIVGAYFFPGWRANSPYYDDIQGRPDSRSPHRAWPDRQPLLGCYPEEDPATAERQIAWAAEYGITFFAYDTYWHRGAPALDHAIRAHLAAKNRDAVKAAILWVVEPGTPTSISDFDKMITYWIDNYLGTKTFFRIGRRPLLFVLNPETLETNAHAFDSSTTALLLRAQESIRRRLHTAALFIGVSDRRPTTQVARDYAAEGFHAFTGWNYVLLDDATKDSDYESMVRTYQHVYETAPRNGSPIPYVATASPGYDNRPWFPQNRAIVRRHATPAKFEEMLNGAMAFIRRQRVKTLPKVLMIEAWNEYAEGSFIAPSRALGFAYLEALARAIRSR